ncbi:YbhB/YbcL family Raf kinase inhibitor-like protein [Leuconostoc pseudomesenteroides]|uniref:YbhB/YbcL family Raf kinase inhibitor-like protein n=1 Tax=Leuconostoc pseudomesenteroides TaxID=33968 RepID=UPI00301C5D90
MSNPIDNLQKVQSFKLVSNNLNVAGMFAKQQYSGMFGVEGGQDESPELSWSGVPAETKSFTLTMYDPDAPTQSGFWHWVMMNIPANTQSLVAGAGAANSDKLPEGTLLMPNDARAKQYIGAAPAKGDAPHHYYVTLTALDVAKLDIPDDSTPAFMNFNMIGHELGRAVLEIKAEIK